LTDTVRKEHIKKLAFGVLKEEFCEVFWTEKLSNAIYHFLQRVPVPWRE
jgi:hypothetical protein